eukprot:7021746-Lingulodinium_polyedra.AAC.1
MDAAPIDETGAGLHDAAQVVQGEVGDVVREAGHQDGLAHVLEGKAPIGAIDAAHRELVERVDDLELSDPH